MRGTPQYRTLEQRQELLNDNYPTPRGFIGRVEASGQQIDRTLNQLQLSQNYLSLTANACAFVTSFIALTQSMWALSLPGVMESLSLGACSLLLLIVDMPGGPKWNGYFRNMIRTQARFVTKLTGRGFVYINMSCLSYLILWSVRRGLVGFMLGATLMSIVLIIGMIDLFTGLSKSFTLERVRKQLLQSYGGNISELFRKYATTDCAHGLSEYDMSRLIADSTQNLYNPSPDDMWIIMSALDDASKGTINETEFNNWVSGGFLYL